MNTKDLWDMWNSQRAPNYPHNKVVQYALRRFPVSQRKTIRVLDLACGSGANTVFFAENDFSVTATDVSGIAVRFTRERLSQRGLEADVRQESAWEIKSPDSQFDVVVCVGLLEALSFEDAVRTLREIRRVLNPSGEAFLIFAANDDFRITGSNELELKGYSEAEVGHLAGMFPINQVDVYTSTYQGGLLLQKDWMLRVGRENTNGFA